MDGSLGDQDYNFWSRVTARGRTIVPESFRVETPAPITALALTDPHAVPAESQFSKQHAWGRSVADVAFAGNSVLKSGM